MPMLRRFTLLLTIALLLIVSPAFARAQNSVSFAELQIAFWPEYDRQAMLVIYRGTLSPETPLPAEVQIDIPAQFGPPSAVAFGDPQGQLFDLDHTLNVSGDTMTIAFNSPSVYFQFEYYDTSLDLSSVTRHYSFETTAPLPIQTLILQVQQPAGASALSATPSVGDAQMGSDGMIYFEASLTDVATDDPVVFDLTYSKPTDALSVDALNPAVTPQLPAPTTEPQVDNATLSIIAGLAGALLLGGGAVWLLRLRSLPTENKRRATATGQPLQPSEVEPPNAATEAAQPGSASILYCHACGARRQPDDHFCRDCGTALRR